MPTSLTLGVGNKPSGAGEKRFSLYLLFLISQCSTQSPGWQGLTPTARAGTAGERKTAEAEQASPVGS